MFFALLKKIKLSLSGKYNSFFEKRNKKKLYKKAMDLTDTLEKNIEYLVSYTKKTTSRKEKANMAFAESYIDTILNSLKIILPCLDKETQDILNKKIEVSVSAFKKIKKQE
jgi:hypothetical protein